MNEGLLQIAIKAAISAGEESMKTYAEDIEVLMKKDISLINLAYRNINATKQFAEYNFNFDNK